jgi:alcohol dehydrogenase class IV
LAHPSLLPEYVLIDPQLTYTLPPRITAASGLDALSQSIESIWSVGATDESIGYASEALSFVLDHLETAVNKPTPESRMAMAKAAHLAGKAINISKTTAPHALSYAITTYYKVPHGIAVALTLDAFLDYNYRVDEFSCTDPRGVDTVRQRIDLILKLLGNGSIEPAQNRLRLIKENIGCPLNLSEVGIKKNDLLTLARQVNVERLSNNPRKIDATGLNDLLNSIL